MTTLHLTRKLTGQKVITTVVGTAMETKHHLFHVESALYLEVPSDFKTKQDINDFLAKNYPGWVLNT